MQLLLDSCQLGCYQKNSEGSALKKTGIKRICVKFGSSIFSSKLGQNFEKLHHLPDFTDEKTSSKP